MFSSLLHISFIFCQIFLSGSEKYLVEVRKGRHRYKVAAMAKGSDHFSVLLSGTQAGRTHHNTTYRTNHNLPNMEGSQRLHLLPSLVQAQLNSAGLNISACPALTNTDIGKGSNRSKEIRLEKHLIWSETNLILTLKFRRRRIGLKSCEALVIYNMSFLSYLTDLKMLDQK